MHIASRETSLTLRVTIVACFEWPEMEYFWLKSIWYIRIPTQ